MTSAFYCTDCQEVHDNSKHTQTVRRLDGVKHTPGPWMYEYRSYPQGYGQDGPTEKYFVYTESDCMQDIAIVDREADARMFAAAPELLEALEHAADWLDTLLIKKDGEGLSDTGLIRAAINKARGAHDSSAVSRGGV